MRGMRGLGLPALCLVALTLNVVPAMATPREPTTPGGGAASAVDDRCVQYAVTHVNGKWTCFDGVVSRFSAAGDTVSSRVAPSAPVPAAEGDGAQADAGNPGGDVSPSYVIDESHAKRTTTWYYGTGAQVSGNIRMTIEVGLHGHSANVWMTSRASDPVKLTWRLKLMHDKTLAFDDLIFRYPDVQGCSIYKYTCQSYEDRYGDGYNKLPYEHAWKVYWEVYNTQLIVGGAVYPGSPTAQSDRATCYITVPCKFKG